MQPFSCLGVLCFLCISHDLLILQVFSEYEFAANLPAQVCNRTTPLQMQYCTDPGNKSSLFVREGLCAAFESFLNCSSDQPDLGAFEDATPGHLLAPQIEGIYSFGNYTHINLKWDMILLPTTTACDHPPFHVADVDNMIPEVINLTTFANGAFQFSPFNLYLLFNCNRSLISTMSNFLKEDSLACQEYLENQKLCTKLNGPDQIMISSCVQLMPFQELKLHEVLEMLSCSHFHSLVNNTLHPDLLSNWITGMVQLFYGDIDCEHCINNGGQCIFNGWFNETTRNFVECRLKVKDCSGFLCTRIKIVTGVTTAVAAIALCMMLYFWINHRRKSRYSTKRLPSSASSGLVTQRAYMLSKKFGPVDTREFSFETLSKATKSFADENMIGDGGFGAVYLGILRDGRKVAVKRLYHDSFRRMDHFYNEIKILSSIDHPNLVKLYGFCCEDSRDLLLVFEYASNGTVFDQLHDDTKPAMPWKTRLNIARETAEALAYLHNSKTPPIYHRDVKTTNILLDDNLGVKLADFGLSRLVPLEATHVSTAPQGTPGYLDPEYHQCYQLTDKSDVYSFGVVLVELVSAKLAVDMSRDRREINLSSLALMKIGCSAWEDLVDPRLGMKENPEVQMMVKRVLEIAFMCLNAEKDNRPTMKCVAETLASMRNEFGYGSGSEYNASSFRMDMNGLSPVHV